MSDEPFRRPGSEPPVDTPPAKASGAGWQPDIDPTVEAAPASQATPVPTARSQRGSGLRSGAFIGVAGLMAGLVIGAVFLEPPEPQPLAITRDTFPREVFGQQRDGYLTPVVEGLDAELQDQVDGYRFAYGGDGARFSYGTYALTIVNGRMPTVLPTGREADSQEIPWVVSLRSSTTRCVSQDPPQNEPPPFELTEILADDSKDVFYWLEEGRTKTFTECVLFDERRNLSLRLEGSGWVENNLQTASAIRDQLVKVHAELTD